MNPARALLLSLKPTRDRLFVGLLFWAVGLCSAWVGSRPFASALHAAFDTSTTAREVASGGGVDLLAEAAMHQPGLFGGGFSMVLIAGAGSLLLGLFLSAGAYGCASGTGAPAWRNIWGEGARLFLPALAVLLLSGLACGLAAALPFGAVVGVSLSMKESTDPSVDLNLALAQGTLLLLFLGLFRAASGFGRAWYVGAGGSTNAALSFLAGLKFSLRRVLVAQPVTWGFLAARWGLIALAAWVLSPGHATDGEMAASFLLAQAGFFAAGYLKVAEIGWHTAYLGELPAEQAREAALAQAADRAPVPEAVEAPPEAQEPPGAEPVEAAPADGESPAGLQPPTAP